MKPWRSDFSLQTDHPSDHYPPIQPESPASSPSSPRISPSTTLSDPFSLSLFFLFLVSFVRSNQIPGVRGRSARSLGLPRKFSHSYLGAVPILSDGRRRWTWGWVDDRPLLRPRKRAHGGRKRFVSNLIAERREVITIISFFPLSLSLVILLALKLTFRPGMRQNRNVIAFAFVSGVMGVSIVSASFFSIFFFILGHVPRGEDVTLLASYCDCIIFIIFIIIKCDIYNMFIFIKDIIIIIIIKNKLKKKIKH